MPVRHAVVGHLSFEGNRHRGGSKAAQTLAGGIFCPAESSYSSEEDRVGFSIFLSFFWLLSIVFWYVQRTVARCHFSPGSINTSSKDIILRQLARPGLGDGGFFLLENMNLVSGGYLRNIDGLRCRRLGGILQIKLSLIFKIIAAISMTFPRPAPSMYRSLAGCGKLP